MKKTIFSILFMSMSLLCYSQDWFNFNRYHDANDSIKANNDYPEVVFMGNSITQNWAYYHPEFFNKHHFCGRGIGGQTSSQMLVRFMSDVVELHPKAVVIMAGTNDVAHNDYYVSHDQVVNNIIAMCQLAQANGIIPIISSIPPCAAFPWSPTIVNPGQIIVDINEKLKEYAANHGIVYVDYHAALVDENLGLPQTLSDDGCHPNAGAYFTMEKMVLQAIEEALK